ncbi:hypothetical protein [Absidia glauca]|uniref:Uncharacterized protein n=1 Tax=Absidia glauca TaxID=4829 RepID=A0A168SF32_ABSGL|nr:hypothetical protein [Absidia glauca]
MTDETTANLLNLLTVEILSTKATVNTISDKVDNLAGEMNSMKDLLNQILAKVSALENNDSTLTPPLHEQSLARPHNSNDKLAVLKAALGTTLATEGFAIDTDQAYAYVSKVANGLADDLTPASYKFWTTKANWKDLRPRKRHIHLDRCVNDWAAREVIRRKILNKARRLQRSLEKTHTSANATSTASPRDNGDNSGNNNNNNNSDSISISASATPTTSTRPTNCAK